MTPAPLPPAPPHPSRGIARLAAACALALILSSSGTGCGDGDEPAVGARPRPTSTPSIVLIDVPGLSRDDVGALPSKRLLASGASFAHACAAAGRSAPSLYAVLTGSMPAGSQSVVPPAVETLAEMLRDEGYETAAFGAGRHVGAGTGLAQGFGSWAQRADPASAARDAAAWVTARAGKPIFVFVSLGGAESPAHAAGALGTIDAAIAALPVGGDVVTIAFSDHGAAPAAERSPLLEGGRLTDDRIRVPLEIRGRGFPDRVVSGSCGLIDVRATVRALLGLPADRGLGGHSLLALASKPDDAGWPVPSLEWVAAQGAESAQCLFAMRSSRAKFVATFTARPPGWTEEAFDLVADPQERAPRPGADAARIDPALTSTVEGLRAALGGKEAEGSDPILEGYGISITGCR